MYQHLHAALPLERLKATPEPVMLLVEKLLDKDPAQRFQTPNELLKAMLTVSRELAANQGLSKTGSTDSLARPRRQPRRSGRKKISVAKLPITGSDIFGREEDIAFLDRAWANKDVNVVIIYV
jgi:hypothetical protein